MFSKPCKALCLLLCFSVILGTGPVSMAQAQKPVEKSEWADFFSGKSYLKLLELAPTTNYSKGELESVRAWLETEKKSKINGLKEEEKNTETKIKNSRKRLEELNKKPPHDKNEEQNRRLTLQCDIKAFEAKLAPVKIALEHGIKVEYDNYNAKLDLLENWPAEKKRIEADLQSGASRTRRWGNVADIGFREIEPNQEDDIKDGQEAINQMKMLGIMPKEIEDAQITEYVNRTAQNIARNSDLKVPLRLTVLNSKEVNAFALPGGFLFVNRGLIEATESESQFAGVLAHEIAHDVARHGHRLMKKATIASLIYQGVQIGAMILTGGAIGLLGYYLLQYGFQGLGLFLSLELLGVSRDYEIEADILGTQYAWNAGYNPEGFIQLFDAMASKEGYAEKTSFFRTHPAFYERIVAVFREISFLPKKETVEDTTEFHEIQKRLKDMGRALDAEDKNRPTLYAKDKLVCPGDPEKQTPEKVIIPRVTTSSDSQEKEEDKSDSPDEDAPPVLRRSPKKEQ